MNIRHLLACFHYYVLLQYTSRMLFRGQPRLSSIVSYDEPIRRVAYNNQQPCFSCRKFFSGSHQCRISCEYCHDFHLKKDLIENMCPLIYPLAKKEQEKNSFQCKNCRGEGAYTEEIETIKYESKNRYEERVKQWETRLPQNRKEEKPGRRVLYQETTTNQVQCQECHGKGRIMRMQACCNQGCRKCNGDRYIINPVWKRYRKQPVTNDVSFQCPICLMDVEVDAKKYVLDCRHEFHPDCIFRWMKTKKNCPVCRQLDVYMDGIEFPSNFDVGGQAQEPIHLRTQGPIRVITDSYEEDW